MSGLHSHPTAVSQPPKSAVCLSCRAPSQGQQLQQEEGCHLPFRRGKLSSHSISTAGARSHRVTGARSLRVTGARSLRLSGACAEAGCCSQPGAGLQGAGALPEPAAGADARCRAGVSPHAALVEAVILPRERAEVWGLHRRGGAPQGWESCSPRASPYLGVRLLRDLRAVGRVVSLGVVLPQQGPARGKGRQQRPRFGDCGDGDLPGGFGKEGKKCSGLRSPVQ